MRYCLITIFLYFISGLVNPAAAQQQIFKNYTINEGLVSNTIRRVHQDAKGFLRGRRVSAIVRRSTSRP